MTPNSGLGGPRAGVERAVARVAVAPCVSHARGCLRLLSPWALRLLRGSFGGSGSAWIPRSRSAWALGISEVCNALEGGDISADALCCRFGARALLLKGGQKNSRARSWRGYLSNWWLPQAHRESISLTCTPNRPPVSRGHKRQTNQPMLRSLAPAGYPSDVRLTLA